MAAVRVVDDSDPAVIYSSGWQKAGSGNEYDSTNSWANQPGVTMNFTFVGIQISVMGTVGPSVSGLASPQSNYSIDGGMPTQYTADQDQSVHYNTRFHQSPILPYDQHTLVVTNLRISDPLYLDYFLVYGSATGTSSVSLKVSTVSMVTVTRHTMVLFTSTSDTGVSTSSFTAAIVGTIFGAVVFSDLSITIFIYLRGRKKKFKQGMARPEALEPTSRVVGQPYYGTRWGTQQSHTAQQLYPSKVMGQRAQNGTYNPQQHEVVDPLGVIAQQTPPPAYSQLSSLG